jgi:ATP-dependent Clp protease protease subunit
VKVSNNLHISNKAENEITLEIVGDIGYNPIADTYEDYKKNTSENMAKELKAIASMKADVINVVLESLGGDLLHALSIHSLLKNSGAKVKTYLRGANASSSTIIASSASSVEDIYMDSSGLYLIHKPMSHVSGNSNDLEQMAKMLKQWQKALENAYINLGVKQEVLSDLMERNGGHGEWLTFEDAKKYGFVGNEWKTNKVVNYSNELFIKNNLLTPKNLKMDNKEKSLFKKFIDFVNKEDYKEEEEDKDKVTNEATMEEVLAENEALKAKVAELEALLMEASEAIEEAVEVVEEEVTEVMEEEILNKIKSLKNSTSKMKAENKTLKTELKNLSDPKPKAESRKVTIDANAPLWKQIHNAHKQLN